MQNYLDTLSPHLVRIIAIDNNVIQIYYNLDAPLINHCLYNLLEMRKNIFQSEMEALEVKNPLLSYKTSALFSLFGQWHIVISTFQVQRAKVLGLFHLAQTCLQVQHRKRIAVVDGI